MTRIFIIDRNAQTVDADKFVDGMKSFIHNPLGNQLQALFLASCLTRSHARGFEHQAVYLEHLLQVPTIDQPLAEVEEIIPQRQNEEKKDRQPNAYHAVAGRSLQLAAIVFQRLVLAQQFVEGRIGIVVIPIGIPALQRHKGHRRLVANVQYHMVVRIEPGIPPLQLCRTALALQCHRHVDTPIAISVGMLVQAPHGGIDIRQRLFVLAVDVAIVGRIGIV